MNPNVLIVEDEPNWSEVLVELVSDLGGRAWTANNFDGALAVLMERPYDLAILDVSLARDNHENQDGLRVLEQLRARHPRAKAVLLTGYGTVELAVQALTTLGADDFIRKEQFDRRRFSETLTRVLGRRNGVTPAPAAAPRVEVAPQKAEPLSQGRVLVVEDNPAWRAIYGELFEELGCEYQTAVSYGEARGWLQRHSFALAVVDLKLINSTAPWENRDGLYLLRLTHEHQVPTIIVSALAAPEEIDRAYEEFGIFAFFDKEGFQRHAFLRTVQDALTSGERPTESSAPAPADGRQLPAPLNELTERQIEVLALIAQGKTNKEIADVLVITTNTVKKHILAIFAKLDVNSRAAAAAEAAKWGIGA